MATRSTIYVEVKPEQIGTTITPKLELLPEGVTIQMENELPLLPVKIDQKFIGIYHHWDGYPSGVGATLNSDYNDHEKALNLVLLGDESSINAKKGESIAPYHYWRGEDWKHTAPKQLPSVQEIHDKDEEYLYLYTLKYGWLLYIPGAGWSKLADALEASRL